MIKTNQTQETNDLKNLTVTADEPAFQVERKYNRDVLRNPDTCDLCDTKLYDHSPVRKSENVDYDAQILIKDEDIKKIFEPSLSSDKYIFPLKQKEEGRSGRHFKLMENMRFQKPARVNWFQRTIIEGYLKVFCALMKFANEQHREQLISVDWHFQLENLNNTLMVFKNMKEFSNNTQLEKYSYLCDELKEAFRKFYEATVQNLIVQDDSFPHADHVQWKRLMDIGRMSETNQIFTKEQENYLKEFMLRVNNQLTYYLDLSEVQMNQTKEDESEKGRQAGKDWDKLQAKHRIMHEFDIIFQQELDMHMGSIQEVALDIFAEAYSKLYSLMNFNELFLTEVERINGEFYTKKGDKQDIIQFMKRIKLNITKIISERHINRYVSFIDLEHLFNEVAKNFMLDQGLTKAGKIFELRAGQDNEKEELKDLILEPHDPQIDLDPNTDTPIANSVDGNSSKLQFNMRFDQLFKVYLQIKWSYDRFHKRNHLQNMEEDIVFGFLQFDNTRLRSSRNQVIAMISHYYTSNDDGHFGFKNTNRSFKYLSGESFEGTFGTFEFLDNVIKRQEEVFFRGSFTDNDFETILMSYKRLLYSQELSQKTPADRE